MDCGASDHMTGDKTLLHDVECVKICPKINLPTGKHAYITHKGKVKLENGIILKQVLYVPEFKHNLMSINKLIKDEKC